MKLATHRKSVSFILLQHILFMDPSSMCRSGSKSETEPYFSLYCSISTLMHIPLILIHKRYSHFTYYMLQVSPFSSGDVLKRDRTTKFPHIFCDEKNWRTTFWKRCVSLSCSTRKEHEAGRATASEYNLWYMLLVFILHLSLSAGDS